MRQTKILQSFGFAVFIKFFFGAPLVASLHDPTLPLHAKSDSYGVTAFRYLVTLRVIKLKKFFPAGPKIPSSVLG